MRDKILDGEYIEHDINNNNLNLEDLIELLHNSIILDLIDMEIKIPDTYNKYAIYDDTCKILINKMKYMNEELKEKDLIVYVFVPEIIHNTIEELYDLINNQLIMKSLFNVILNTANNENIEYFIEQTKCIENQQKKLEEINNKIDLLGKNILTAFSNHIIDILNKIYEHHKI